MDVKFGGDVPSARIEVADPHGRIAAWLGIRPGPLKGDEKLTVEVNGPDKEVVKLAERVRDIAGVDEVSVSWL